MRTVEDFLDNINRSKIKNFKFKILTNEGNNDGYYELFSTMMINRNLEEKVDTGTFIYKLCSDKDDYRVIRLLLDKEIIDENLTNKDNGMVHLIVVI